MCEKTSRIYVLVEIAPGFEQEFANEIVSAGLILDPKIEKMDFIHGDFNFIIIFSGKINDVENRILEIRKLKYVQKTKTMIPFETLNWEVLSSTYSRIHSLPSVTPKSIKTTKEEIGTKKILIIYNSLSGNTEKMAIAIAEGAKTVKNTQVELKHIIRAEELPSYDAIIVGAPTYHEDIPDVFKKLFEDASTKEINLKGKIGASFGSYGWDGKATKDILEIMKYKFEMKIDEDPLLIKNKPDRKGLEQCKDFGKRVAESAFDTA